MVSLDINNVKGDLLQITVRPNPYSVSEVDLGLLPQEFIRTIPEKQEPDKKAILEHFKATGELINGVEINRTLRLSIK
jgi:hypothetical protein